MRLKFSLISLLAFVSMGALGFVAGCSGGSSSEKLGVISAIWANDGGDKVAREETRATANPKKVLNRIWDGSKIRVFGAGNETVAFNLVIEATEGVVKDVSVSFASLRRDGGGELISSIPAKGNEVFRWQGRNIENFYIRYLPVQGLSQLSYQSDYDERHVPFRFRRPFSSTGSTTGSASGSWGDRPDHDKHYPDIAVPHELVPSFSIASNESQSIWTDIFIPKGAPAGIYRGTLRVRILDATFREIPVELTVHGFALPDVPTAKTMVFLGEPEINERYTGVTWPNTGTPADQIARRVRDRHFQMAHRHRLSLIDIDHPGAARERDRPSPLWISRLDGSLFTAAHGYDGPGIGSGNGVYSIGTYHSWDWKDGSEADMRAHVRAWERWFAENFPETERFLYLIDESQDYEQIEKWAQWLKPTGTERSALRSFATLDLLASQAQTPSLDIAATWMRVGNTTSWEGAVNRARMEGKPIYLYNANRPASGTFALEDDGVALRELAWGQFKKKIDRWFYWESTYYTDYQNYRGPTNVFQTALTFGKPSANPVTGQTGSNGDGVLFYPGTDRLFPSDSYRVEGPIASLRMKHWRRGIQDVDYLALARVIDPAAVDKIVQRMVPKVLWEYGAGDETATWVKSDISWSVNPDDWEAARSELALIIDRNL